MPDPTAPARQTDLTALRTLASRLWNSGPAGQAEADHVIDARAEIERLRAEVKRLRDEACRWYRADGTYETFGAAGEVIYQRKRAAAEIERLKAEVERLAAWQDKVVSLAQWKDDSGYWRWRLGQASGRFGMSDKNEAALLKHIENPNAGTEE